MKQWNILNSTRWGRMVCPWEGERTGEQREKDCLTVSVDGKGEVGWFERDRYNSYRGIWRIKG